MNALSHFSVDELRASLVDLHEKCPVHQDNPEDCPLFPLRRLERSERLRWFNALSETDLGYLATYHCVCMNLKLQSSSDGR